MPSRGYPLLVVVFGINPATAIGSVPGAIDGVIVLKILGRDLARTSTP
jgi:hypothetical protein